MARIVIAAALALAFVAAGSAAQACDPDTIQSLKLAAQQPAAGGKGAAAAGPQAMINASHLELECSNETSGTESYEWAFRSAKDAGLAAMSAHQGGLTAVSVQFLRLSTQLFQRLRPLAPSVGDRSAIDAELNSNRVMLQAWTK